MKKILFLLIAIVFIGCEKETPEETKSNLLVNVYYKYEGSDKEKLASPSLVRIYKESPSEFDFEESIWSMVDDQSMTLKNGDYAIPVYTSDSHTGVNIIEVENGQYTIIAYFKPEGYSFAMFYFFGYKQVNVTSTVQYNIVFNWGSLGSDVNDAGHFVSK